MPAAGCRFEKKTVALLSGLADAIDESIESLASALAEVSARGDIAAQAGGIRDEILPRMDALRKSVDEAETLTSSEYWPYPSYGELLFGVR